VRDIGRRPGQKEDRWEQLLGESAEPSETPPQPPPAHDPLEDRVAALERQVAEILEQLGAAN
jgi:uncharacterized protein YceH (UPF0502 family)